MKTVIIDIGGYNAKYGVDEMKVKRSNMCYYKKDKFEIGKEVKGSINIKPIKNRTVVDWENLEKMLERFVLYDLEITDTSEYVVINIYKEDDPKFRDIFIKLGFKGYYWTIPESLILIEKRRDTCLIVDIGHDITKITPICDGYTLESGVIYSSFSGSAIDKVLKIKSHMKEKMFWSEPTLEYLEREDMDLCRDIKKSIERVDINVRKKLMKNIVVTGMCFSNDMKNRLDKKLGVITDHIPFCAWKGGLKLSKTSLFKKKVKLNLN